jgi:hypothetical protein
MHLDVECQCSILVHSVQLHSAAQFAKVCAICACMCGSMGRLQAVRFEEAGLPESVRGKRDPQHRSLGQQFFTHNTQTAAEE